MGDWLEWVEKNECHRLFWRRSESTWCTTMNKNKAQGTFSLRSSSTSTPSPSFHSWLAILRGSVTCYLCRKAFPDHLLWRKPSPYSVSQDITICQYFVCVYLFPYVLLSHYNTISMRIPPYFFSPLYFLLLIRYFLEHSRSWTICVEWKKLKATLYCSIAVWPRAR